MRLLLCLPILFAAACSLPEDEWIAEPIEPPTYERDVAPIIAQRCASCHEDGGIAPFPLETYEDAASRANEIAHAVLTRRMPPFGVDNSGACNEYRDAVWLNDGELDVFYAWADSGATRGIGPPNPPIELGERPLPIIPTATIDIGVDYTPDRSRPDDYRCFVVDPGLDETRFLTGYAVRPGDKSIVHHIILFGLAGEDAENEVLALDAADERPGYACFGGPGTSNIRFLAGWAPGGEETHYPPLTGIEVPAGRKMVMQIHYHAAGAERSDRTRIDLQLAGAVEREAIVLPLADLELSLMPGLERATTSTEVTIDDPPAYGIYGVFPHMHRLGRTLKVEVTTPNATTCLVDVPNWNFDWQRFFFYQYPLRVNVGDRVKITCTYDTRGRTEVVEWGEGTDDEMCLAGFYVVRLEE